MTIFVHNVSKKVYVGSRQSTGTEETVVSKREIETVEKLYRVDLKAFRADINIFKSEEFRLDLNDKDQRITFCGVGAHHQNGIDEKNIRPFVEKRRAILLNAYARWPDKIDL